MSFRAKITAIAVSAAACVLLAPSVVFLCAFTYWRASAIVAPTCTAGAQTPIVALP